MSRTLAWLAVLAIAIATGWMSGTGRSTMADLAAPITYSGDGLGVLAQIKAYATGELLPMLPKHIASLGAPFGANWTDYPAEDFLYLAAGIVAKVGGFFGGTTVFVLGLHLLAGIAFFVVASALGYRRPAAFASALLFALAPFGFFRNLNHLTLTAYWHVPLMLYGLLWATGGPEVRSSTWSPPAQRALAIAGAVLAGFLNPYYLAVFLFLAACALAGALASGRRRSALECGGLLAVAIGAFAIQSLDSIALIATQGGNAGAVSRNFTALDLYGLRLPDLAFPNFHRSAAFQAWADATYQSVAPGGRGRGEAATAYIGLVACAGLALLLVGGTVRIAARQYERVSAWYWMALGTIGLGLVGGINYFLGAFGFVMLRATNRFSIVLMAIALFALCEFLSRRTRAGGTVLAAAALAAFGLWDQIPPLGLIPAAEATRAPMLADAAFTRTLEAALPPRAMVLQLPAKRFPETGPLFAMEDYEHLRPYLHSKALRFSYGTVKGRGDDDWQFEVAALPVPQLAAKAAEYGFGAIYVNRRGYADRAAELEAQLRTLLGAPIADSTDLVAFRITPAATPRLPAAKPIVSWRGFSGLEASGASTWSWAVQQEASIGLQRPYRAGAGGPYEVSFGIESSNGGAVAISLDGRIQASHEAGRPPTRYTLALPAQADRWRVGLRSSLPPRSPGNGDPRVLAFRVVDLEARPTAESPAVAP